MLKEKMGLSDHGVIVPQVLAPLLSLFDGNRDPDGLRSAFMLRTGIALPPSIVESLLNEMDAAYLLESPRSQAALAHAVQEYRAAPCRPTALAGGCYPKDPDELRQTLDGYCHPYRDAVIAPDPAQASRIRGVLSPHIDYARGHATYAQTWLSAAPAARSAELAIIFGTDHLGSEPTLTPTLQSYATPWGTLPTDQEIVKAVATALGEDAALADELHHLREHSIELAAVWLHYLREGRPLTLLPMLCGSFGPLLASGRAPLEDERLAAGIEVLRQATAGWRTLVVAAGDLSHVGPAFGDSYPFGLSERAGLAAEDARLLELVARGDAQGLFAATVSSEDRRRVCGIPPIFWALQLLGGCRGASLGYAQCPADANGGSIVSIAGVLWE
ncbi:MAG: AmmeMemoRadiSam system protein B [Chloroflexi bacterium]|nr:AmmeMemoRadiSam system protein B [Chloroflexota bacterium]